jgi:cadmium resistance transport/sequestration family protein
VAALATGIALGIALFVATNLDDIFILLVFFADRRLRTRNIVAGTYLGMAALVLISVVAALIALVIPPSYVRLLGLIPIVLGVKALIWRDDDDDEEERARGAQSRAHSQAAVVAAVTIANGGDNIGVYVPVFAIQSGYEIAVIVSVFVVMTALWCALAHWLVNHPTIGAPIRRYGHRILPFVLIGVGVMVMLS